jgi:hypothetical protein
VKELARWTTRPHRRPHHSPPTAREAARWPTLFFIWEPRAWAVSPLTSYRSRSGQATDTFFFMWEPRAWAVSTITGDRESTGHIIDDIAFEYNCAATRFLTTHATGWFRAYGTVNSQRSFKPIQFKP